VSEKALEDYLKDNLVKIFPETPRLLVEGINAPSIEKAMETPYGINYVKDIKIPSGERCLYILEEKYWQGTNGSEDISDQIVDYLLFRKPDLMSAVEKAIESTSCVVELVGERIRDDGYWEDGIPCFKYTVLDNVKMVLTLSLNPTKPILALWHDSQIEPELHPEKYHADYDQIVF